MSVLRRFDDAECRAWFAAAVAMSAFANRRGELASAHNERAADRAARARSMPDAHAGVAPRNA